VAVDLGLDAVPGFRRLYRPRRGRSWLGVVVDDRRYAEQSVRWPNVSGVLSSVVITH